MRAKLQDYKGSEFNVVELVNKAKQLLERSAIPPTDGRVSPFPDTRTVRYYQTVGILKKPLRYEGRNAVYGYHHLIQLIAVKLLQRQGLSLAQIQRALIQVTLTDLEKNLEAAIKMEEEPSTAEDQQVFTIASPPLSMGKIEEPVPCSEMERKGSLEVPMYQRSKKMVGRNLVAVEVAPGITVQIDPGLVEDPRLVIQRIIQLFNAKNGDVE